MKNLKSRKIILTLAIVLAVITGLTFSVNADEIQQINPTLLLIWMTIKSLYGYILSIRMPM